MVLVVAVAVVLLIITVKKKRNQRFFGKSFSSKYAQKCMYRQQILPFNYFLQIWKSQQKILLHDTIQIMPQALHQPPKLVVESIIPPLTLIFLKCLNKCRKNKQCHKLQERNYCTTQDYYLAQYLCKYTCCKCLSSILDAKKTIFHYFTMYSPLLSILLYKQYLVY